MSNITNLRGFPQAIIDAMKADPYDNGGSDFTATSLLKPARMVALEKRYKHEITEDAEDGLYRLYGQLVHMLLERANASDLAEKRYFGEFKVGGKTYKVSAQMDNLTLTQGILRDYKFTTAYGFKKGQPVKPDWVAQLNIQNLLMIMNGETRVQALEIIGLLRDFQMREAKFNVEYPQAPVVIQPLPMWQPSQTEAFIKMRIAAHVDAANALPECSPDERWAKPDAWAVMKGKRAINGGVQFTEAAAKSIFEKNPGTRIEHRPGESIRCANYCAVAQFCTQFQRTKNENVNAKSEEESA